MIVIINYGIGNLDSVVRAFRRADAAVAISSDVKAVEAAEGVVLPGVGSFEPAMATLRDSGLLPVLNRRVFEARTPVLGICLGFQMFTRHSEEGDAEGLGWLDGRTRRLSCDLPIPHIGWNDTARRGDSILFAGVPEDASFYFAHSYCVECQDDAIRATTEYGESFASAVEAAPIFGTQFHPEKSLANGLKVVRNFVEYCRHA
jgi:glutamine amidotransferase